MTKTEWSACYVRLKNFGYSMSDAVKWMQSPHPQLDGRKAADAKYDEVVAIIDRLESGAYI